MSNECASVTLIPAIKKLFGRDLIDVGRAYIASRRDIEHTRDMSIELAKHGYVKKDLLKRIVFPDRELPNSEEEMLVGVRRFVENFTTAEEEMCDHEDEVVV